MLSTKLIKRIEMLSNFFELAGLIVVLILALVFQLLFQELPCPLCHLQRVGFMYMAFGFLLNFRYGLRPSHYAIVLLSGLYTSFVALRQIALHVIPGTGAYGSAVLGLHLYTWSFVISMIIVVVTTLQLGVDRQYQPSDSSRIKWPYLTHLLFAIVAIIIFSNIVSVIFECGFALDCADNPVSYELLNDRAV